LFLAVLFLASASIVGFQADPADGANDEWAKHAKAFKAKFEIGGLEHPGKRGNLRGKKRSAIEALRKTKDGRAVATLLKAHKKQLKFIAELEAQWVARMRAWTKAAPGMRKVFAERQKRAGPGKGIPMNVNERAWNTEMPKLKSLRRDIADEEGLAETMRKAMARVINTVDGAEKTKAFGLLLKAVDKGQKPEEREFLWVLGLVEGDDATETLERLAKDISPFVAQAALEGLGRQQCPRSIDTLLARLDDPRWQLRVAALRGLSYFRDARIVDKLLERLPTEDGVLKRHYYTALARILAKDLAATDEAWTSYWKDNKAEILKRWATKDRSGPVQEELAPAAIKSAGTAGGTSFYGLRTESKHIIFIIDVSGSMGEVGGKNEQGHYRVDVAKRELANAIRTLRAEDGDARGAASFNIVAFAAEVDVYRTGKMVDATAKEKDKAFKWIEGLKADGGTATSDALEHAFEIIKTRKALKQFEKGADTIFLMTDGKPSLGKIIEPLLIREMVKKMNRERQITINTIGVGDGHDADFLKGLASENNGEYLAR
jgi:uncharacterized protein YegL